MDKKEEFNTLFEKYVPQCISLILEGIVDGRQGEKLKTIVPLSNLNMVSSFKHMMNSFEYVNEIVALSQHFISTVIMSHNNMLEW